MKEYQQYLFLFLYRCDLPPDSNASERAVRTFKVKQKVSGLFCSLEGAAAFAVIRSLIDTVIKNGQNVVRAGSAMVAEGKLCQAGYPIKTARAVPPGAGGYDGQAP